MCLSWKLCYYKFIIDRKYNVKEKLQEVLSVKKYTKSYIVWTILLLVVITYFMFARDFHSLNGKLLERDKDTEFEKGSGIRTKKLLDVQIQSLYKLCKVWGYTKYHHPDVISGKLNWDAELFRVMPDILRAANQDGADCVLMDWLETFPVEGEQDEGKEEDIDWEKIQEESGKQLLDTTWISDSAFWGEELSEYLCSMADLHISDRENAYASFEEIGTVSFENEKMYDASDGDMGMYLLGLFRFWNMYEYYSPNIEITTEEWDSVLLDALPKVADSGDYRSYVTAIAQVVSKTGDAHSMLVDRERLLYYYYGQRFLPCDIKIIGGEAVVTQVKKNEKELMPGDILLEIDGMTLEERIEEQRNYHALSEADKMLNQMKHLLLATEKRKAKVRILRGEETKTVQVKTLKNQYSYKNPIENGILQSENIGYIDPSALEKGNIEKLMKDFCDTEGIIIDLRHYPSTVITYLLGEYIIPKQKVFACIGMPNKAMPGAFYEQEMVVGKGVLKEIQNDSRTFDSYEGKVIILMDEESQSQSEFAIMALRQAPNAIVVGSPSVGADGNVVKVSLPGEVIFSMTGLGVYTPEGEQTQRCGLKPDIECWQTVEGIKAGKDELLEEAIKLIK